MESLAIFSARLDQLTRGWEAPLDAKIMNQSAKKPRKLSEATAMAVGGCSSVPLSLSGRPLIKLYHDLIVASLQEGDSSYTTEAVFCAAIQNYALSIGAEDLYRICLRDYTVSVPNVSEFRFVRSLWRLARSLMYPSLEIDRAEVLAILWHLTDLSGKITAQKLYSPFFEREIPESQIEVTHQVMQLRMALERDILALEERKMPVHLRLIDPVPGIVVGSICRSHLLPTAMPANNALGDFDSGYCDKLSNTSFRNGDRVVIFASYREFVLISMDGAYGWVRNKDVATLPKSGGWQIGEGYSEVFYTGNLPIFVDSRCVALPGDSLWRDNINYYYADRKVNGMIDLKRLPDMYADQLKVGLKTPQQVLGFLYNARLPYIYSLFDCSELGRRALNMVGCTIRKHSADALEDLTIALGDPKIALLASDLDTLETGLYHMNLLSHGSDHKQISKHVYWVTVRGERIEVFSLAFQLVGDDGVMEYPVGPHVCGREALVNQLQKGRYLAFHKVASL